MGADDFMRRYSFRSRIKPRPVMRTMEAMVLFMSAWRDIVISDIGANMSIKPPTSKLSPKLIRNL